MTALLYLFRINVTGANKNLLFELVTYSLREAESFLKKLIVTEVLRNFPPFMEPESILQYAQETGRSRSFMAFNTMLFLKVSPTRLQQFWHP
jgi:hypothetical protein